MNTEAEKQRILNPKRHADPDDVVESDYEGPYERQCEQIADIMSELLDLATAFKASPYKFSSRLHGAIVVLANRSDEFEAAVINAATQRMRERGELD